MTDELYLYPDDRIGSWTAVDLNGSLHYNFGSRQEKEFTLSAAGYRMRKGISFFHPREPEIWVKQQS